MTDSYAMITPSGKIYLATVILMENLVVMDPDAMAQNKDVPPYGTIQRRGFSSVASLDVRTNQINSSLSTLTVSLLPNT